MSARLFPYSGKLQIQVCRLLSAEQQMLFALDCIATFSWGDFSFPLGLNLPTKLTFTLDQFSGFMSAVLLIHYGSGVSVP